MACCKRWQQTKICVCASVIGSFSRMCLMVLQDHQQTPWHTHLCPTPGCDVIPIEHNFKTTFWLINGLQVRPLIILVYLAAPNNEISPFQNTGDAETSGFFLSFSPWCPRANVPAHPDNKMMGMRRAGFTMCYTSCFVCEIDVEGICDYSFPHCLHDRQRGVLKRWLGIPHSASAHCSLCVLRADSVAQNAHLCNLPAMRELITLEKCSFSLRTYCSTVWAPHGRSDYTGFIDIEK